DSVNNRLFVADQSNNRVLVFSTASISDGMNASNVLGQTNFNSASPATTQSGLDKPIGVAFDVTNNQVYVGDSANNRVLLFSTSSIINGENASDLVGQYTSLTSTATVTYTKNGPNNGPTALGFAGDGEGLALDAVNHRLFVGDGNNNRVLVYTLNTDNSFPAGSGGHTASYVLGQPDLISNGAAQTQSGMNDPSDLAFDAANNRLFVADYFNGRVLVYNTSSITSGMNASYVLGKAGFTGSGVGSQASIGGPTGLAYDSANSRLFVADFNNNRVLVFGTASISNGENASNVLGQTNYTNTGAAAAQSRMSSPASLALDSVNSRLFVADSANNRVLDFATASISDGMNASNVLGQTNFTNKGAATTQNRMNSPSGVAYDANNDRLFVTDSANARVLVFNTKKITNGMNATNVLGETAFTSVTPATGQANLWSPGSMYYDPGSSRLFVADPVNNRVMIFDGSYLPSW